MRFGVLMNTHGVGARDDHDWWHQPMPAEEMRPVECAQIAERLGFDALMFGDHVGFPETSPTSTSPVHVEGLSDPTVRHRGEGESDVGGSKRHYPPRPNLLDGAVVMGAIAANTSRIKMGPGVLISPYRHPLSDARQFATIDFLSNGRLLMGAGAGWMREEFEVLGHDPDERLAMLEECVQIYTRAWEDPLVTFHGRFYDFENVTIDPKPVQKPHPPIVIGATTNAGARLAVRYADGLYPILNQPLIDPHHYDRQQDEMRRECEKIGRDPSELIMMGIVSARISDADDEEATRSPRRNFGGTAEQILGDVQRFADAGYSMLILCPDCPSRTFEEWKDQMERFGAEVLPEASTIKPAGEWRTDF